MIKHYHDNNISTMVIKGDNSLETWNQNFHDITIFTSISFVSWINVFDYILFIQH
jgi:hypothetical protein